MPEPTLEELLQQAETREEPETTADPQEDKTRTVPIAVNITDHRSEGVS